MRYIDTQNPVADHPLNDGLIAWWIGLPHNSGGSSVLDIRGACHGELANGAAWDTRKVALGTGGGSSRVNVGLPTKLQVAKVTVVMAVCLKSTNLYQKILHWGNFNESGGYGFFQDFGGGNYPNWFIGDGSRQSIQSSSPLVLNQDCLLIGTYDQSTLAIYYNGLSAGSSSVSSSISYSGSASLTIGNLPASVANQAFGGDILSTRIYDRAISANEVFALYEDWRRDYKVTLNRLTRSQYLFSSSGSGGNRRRRVLIAGCVR